MGTGLWLIGRRADPRYKTEEKEHNTLFVCPERAQIFARADWDRARLQAAHTELGWLADHPELPLPIVEDPECFDIAVLGGAAGQAPGCLPGRSLPTCGPVRPSMG